MPQNFFKQNYPGSKFIKISQNCIVQLSQRREATLITIKLSLKAKKLTHSLISSHKLSPTPNEH